MTRLEQALRWWRNHDGEPIPYRHLKALRAAEFLSDRLDGDECCVLNRAGHAAMKAEAESEAD